MNGEDQLPGDKPADEAPEGTPPPPTSGGPRDLLPTPPPPPSRPGRGHEQGKGHNKKKDR